MDTHLRTEIAFDKEYYRGYKIISRDYYFIPCDFFHKL